jgi:hypothetical protein
MAGDFYRFCAGDPMNHWDYLGLTVEPEDDFPDEVASKCQEWAENARQEEQEAQPDPEDSTDGCPIHQVTLTDVSSYVRNSVPSDHNCWVEKEGRYEVDGIQYLTTVIVHIFTGSDNKIDLTGHCAFTLTIKGLLCDCPGEPPTETLHFDDTIAERTVPGGGIGEGTLVYHNVPDKKDFCP